MSRGAPRSWAKYVPKQQDGSLFPVVALLAAAAAIEYLLPGGGEWSRVSSPPVENRLIPNRFDQRLRCSASAGFSGMILHRLETFCGELIEVAVLHHIPCDDELFDFAVPVVGERDGLADVS
jgi:hypothetical protein